MARVNRRERRKRSVEFMLPKVHMTRKSEAYDDGIITMVSLLVNAISKKATKSEPGSNLLRSCIGKKNKERTTKHPKRAIVRSVTE